MSHDLRKSKHGRLGFTLVELLVVIAIMVILAAIGSVAVFAMIGVRQQRNTEATIRVVNKLTQDRWAVVIADAKKEAPSTYVKNLANGDLERAKIIWIKVRLMEAFPQKYSEVNTPTTLTTLINDQKFKPHFAKYQAALTGKSGGGAGESSACLLLALKTLGADGVVSVQDNLGYAIGNSDGVNTIDVLIDSWSNPLVFTRFGQSAAVQQVNPAAAGSRAFKFSDPVDSGGTLLTPSWYSTANRTTFETNIHPIARDSVPNAFFTIPVIASNGKDGVPGNPDDIYSFNLKGD